ncbi:RNA polymerase sigma factor [Microbacterium gilvum]|uniref:RNA polymerase sigma factor n=1 Tax=Microbacterium gilvum TaxID=1336204 RepID=UPI0031E6DAC7
MGRTRGEPVREASDAILVARSLDQDEHAFAEIVRRHAPLMRAYTARMVGSVSEADDVVQNAFILAWRKLDTLRDPSALKAWLMRVATHEATAYLRRRPSPVPLEAVEQVLAAEARPDTVVVRDAQMAALSKALDTLPDAQRQCWLLREVAGLSYTEIAEELDLPASTVRGNLARARTSITVRMEEWR